MKLFRKNETQTPVAAEKDKKVRNMLMQTYLTSLLSLVLCVTMFFGTSYAWFTSEVSNTQNEIYIGILDVDLYKKEGKASLVGNSNQVFDSDVRWEPGYTMLETICVANSGDLAFNYELKFTDGKLKDGSELKVDDVAKCFEVWVHDDKDSAPRPGDYGDISEAKGWEKAGSLDELLAGKTVLKGSMSKVRGQTDDPNPGTTDGVDTEHTYTIALHMKEDATSAVKGQKLTLNVKLIAYQMVSEQDSMTKNYDGITAVSNAEELRTALAKGSDILMTSHITLDGEEDLVIPKTVNLDGNGNTLTIQDTNVKLSGGTISNLTIAGDSLKIENLGAALTLSKCKLPIVNVSKPGANVKFAGCTFRDSLTLADLGANTVTLEHCTYRNQTDACAVFRMQNGIVACDIEALYVNDSDVVTEK